MLKEVNKIDITVWEYLGLNYEFMYFTEYLLLVIYLYIILIVRRKSFIVSILKEIKRMNIIKYICLGYNLDLKASMTVMLVSMMAMWG